MAHIAIQEQLAGLTVDWMEQESSDGPMDKQTASTWRKKPSRSRRNHPFTRGEEINYARNHALRPPGRALRGASRPDNYRTDGRHPPHLGGLRVRVRPVALPWP